MSDFLLNVVEEKCRWVRVSFGVFMIMSTFLEGFEILSLQEADKFSYNHAISGV